MFKVGDKHQNDVLNVMLKVFKIRNKDSKIGLRSFYCLLRLNFNPLSPSIHYLSIITFIALI